MGRLHRFLTSARATTVEDPVVDHRLRDSIDGPGPEDAGEPPEILETAVADDLLVEHVSEPVDLDPSVHSDAAPPGAISGLQPPTWMV